MHYILLILAVLGSYFAVLFTRPKSQANVKLLLAFSGAFLLALTFFELVPKVYGAEQPRTIAFFILLGVLLQIFLEFFSEGTEHGHMHKELAKAQFPLVLFVSLSVHALIEGVPITAESNIIYGILVHKIPVAIVLSIVLVNSELSRLLSLLFITLFALMTPLGHYLSAEIPAISSYSNWLTAIAIGVFLHISTVILFESAKGHAFDLKKLLVIVLGFGIGYFM